jgi:hypothetical protein
MSNLKVINDAEQSALVSNARAKNGEMYLKAFGSTNEGDIVVYYNGSWIRFDNEYSVADFNISTQNTEASIFSTTPTNPTGEVTIAFATDTKSLCIYDGISWATYNNNFTI